MSWSVTVENIPTFEHFPDEVLEDFSRDNEQYPADAIKALRLAKRLGLLSATLAGGRTPLPATPGNESVAVSVFGTTQLDMRSAILSEIRRGPDVTES